MKKRKISWAEKRMDETPLNKLIIIGAPKCGTTTLSYWLDQHPDIIRGARKEPGYFTDYAAREWSGPLADRFTSIRFATLEAYEHNYDCEKPACWALDASTDYLSCPAAPARIAEYARRVQVKLVCVLRDPARRAFSEYAHTMRDSLQTESFEQSLALEDARIKEGWIPLFHHAARSRYGEGLARYREYFAPEELLILPFEDIGNGAALRAIETFIGVRPHQYTMEKVRNRSTAPKSQMMKRLINGDSWPKRIAKAILPARAKSALKAANQTRLEMTPADKAAICVALKGDLALARQLIPFNTAHWICAE